MSSAMCRFKVFGLPLLALCGLTALVAASAQANWLGSSVEGEVTANKNVLATAHTTGKLIVSSLNFEIRCTTLKGEGLKIVGKSNKAEGKAVFTGCTAFQKSDGKEQKNCKPSEPIIASGLALIVKLATIKGESASLKNYILFESHAGKPFTTIVLPELCALAETSEVTGSMVTECGSLSGGVFVAEDCNVARAQHLLQPGPATLWKGAAHNEEAKDILKFGENNASLAGIAAVELESGNSWDGDVQTNWLENGNEITGNKDVVAQAHATVKLVVSALNFEIRCTRLESQGIKIVGKSTKGEGKVTFSFCTSFQISDGKEQKNCKPKEPIIASGLALIVKLAAIKGESASLKNYILFEPEVGNSFTTMTFSELCGLAETSKISGSLVAECGSLSGGAFVGEDCSVARVQHLLQPGPATLWKGAAHNEEVKDMLLFNENTASLAGIAAVELESGNSWAGHV